MVIKRKNFSGYGETMMNGAEYMSAQVGHGLAASVIDPADKLFERWEELPAPLRPKGKVVKIRKGLKPLSKLMKRGKRDKTK